MSSYGQPCNGAVREHHEGVTDRGQLDSHTPGPLARFGEDSLGLPGSVRTFRVGTELRGVRSNSGVEGVAVGDDEGDAEEDEEEKEEEGDGEREGEEEEEEEEEHVEYGRVGERGDEQDESGSGEGSERAYTPTDEGGDAADDEDHEMNYLEAEDGGEEDEEEGDEEEEGVGENEGRRTRGGGRRQQGAASGAGRGQAGGVRSGRVEKRGRGRGRRGGGATARCRTSRGSPPAESVDGARPRRRQRAPASDSDLGLTVHMFGPKTEGRRKCKMCPTTISWQNSTTTSGKRHHWNKHRAHLDIWEQRFNNQLVGEGETFPEKGYEGVPNGGIDLPYCTQWPNFPGAGRQGGVRGRGGMERFVGHRFSVRSLREAVTKMVVTGNVPFRFVELEAAMADLAPRPGERTTGVTISSDIWTGGNGKAYSVVKGHFVIRDWKLWEVTLDFREMTGRHGGEEIADLVLEVVRDWDLVDRCVAFVCDNASSNTRAFHLLSGGSSRPIIFRPGMHVRCTAHLLNLAVQTALKVPLVRKTLRLVRDVAIFVGYSPIRTGNFQAEQVRAYPGRAPLKLVQDSPTRWGLTYEMAVRFLELRRAIHVHFYDDQVRR
ncbi:unnamed protein product [Closterium sp. NIES-53]